MRASNMRVAQSRNSIHDPGKVQVIMKSFQVQVPAAFAHLLFERGIGEKPGYRVPGCVG